MLNPLRDHSAVGEWRAQAVKWSAWTAGDKAANHGRPRELSQVYRHAPVALLCTAGFGWSVAAATRGALPGVALSLWLWSLLITTCLRLLYVWLPRSAHASDAQLAPLYLAGLGLNALAWAALPAIAFGGVDVPVRLTLALAAFGAAGVELLSLGGDPRVAVAQTLVCALPSGLWLLFAAEATARAAGTAALVDCAALLQAIRLRHNHE